VASALIALLGGCTAVDDSAGQLPSHAALSARPGLSQLARPTPKTLASSDTPDGAALVAPQLPRPIAVTPPPANALPASSSAAPAATASSRVAAASESTRPAVEWSRDVPPPSAGPSSGPRLVSIAFEPGSAKPQRQADDVLSVLAARGKNSPLVLIAGYAQPGGEANLTLARQRAFAVRDALVARGVNERRIRTTYTLDGSKSANAARVDVKLVGEGAVREQL
jgi:outer membrane protein OmpA-like peptidoglycan-associated protein